MSAAGSGRREIEAGAVSALNRVLNSLFAAGHYLLAVYVTGRIGLLLRAAR